MTAKILLSVLTFASTSANSASYVEANYAHKIIPTHVFVERQTIAPGTNPNRKTWKIYAVVRSVNSCYAPEKFLVVVERADSFELLAESKSGICPGNVAPVTQTVLVDELEDGPPGFPEAPREIRVSGVTAKVE